MFDDEYFFSEVLQICPYCFVLPVSLATMLPLNFLPWQRLPTCATCPEVEIGSDCGL